MPMTKERAPRLRPLLLFLQGIVIGTGAILPGISGGVLCMAFGLYEPMVQLFAHPLRSLNRNRPLLLPLLLGCGAGFLLLAGAVEYLLRVAPVATTALFAGLICGTIPSLMEQTEGRGSRRGWTGFVLSLVACFVLLSLLESGLGGQVQANTGWFVFCGAIWALSMILPGLSSSSVLLFMGLYQPMAQGIAHFDLAVLLPLGIGFLAAIFLLARVVSRLMERHEAGVTRMLLGFVISSTLLILPVTFTGIRQVVTVVLCLSAGMVLSWGLEHLRSHAAGQEEDPEA